ncbi:WD40/YVTN/BNR-like repeat-containing protein [Confluentibacter flavum]|uniref:Oxidoreductase n=1 Tax=Confluentibacter flavum TaxID=1909700 RepID=A0A2N3HN27_9FLAO|nr:oxidoreductase [Confluentibacter flavum]PKQ46370.1 oxidoreductase [Confluentibacter flavum]
MKQLWVFCICVAFLFSCGKKETFIPRNFNHVSIETIYSDSLLSIRAIDILNDGSLAFAANDGVFGLYNPRKNMWQTSVQTYDTLNLEFRAVAHTATDFFMLSIDNPALLYKTGDQGKMELVYEEYHEGVFYDAMVFWNDEEGIAVGDSMNGCLSIIITRDAGNTWNKITCDKLPKAEAGEGAFAASNTNIKIIGDKTWIGTTAGNIYMSEDKGLTWNVVKTPIGSAKATEGIYSIDFYDELNGFAIGGDYTYPDVNAANKIKTSDGGKTWQLVAENKKPGYRSCVQFVPNSSGKELVAIGFKGIDFSNDFGESWKHLSDEPFYTIRFLNDSVAYAAGSKRISKLTFSK